MKKSIIKFFDKIIVVSLGFAGVFVSCDKPDAQPLYGVQPEYGVLQTEYQIKEITDTMVDNLETQNIELERKKE